MSETPVCEVCGRAKGYGMDQCGVGVPHVYNEEEDCYYRLGYERARAALSAAEKREARLLKALLAIVAWRSTSSAWRNPQDIAKAAILEASAASEVQPPPASSVPIASSTQEGE